MEPRLSKIAGIDEAGRGCLAGPVVACAVILPPVFHLSGLADSKRLSAHKRERLAPQIKSQALSWGIGIVWQRRIEEINILAATLEAMAKAASMLKFEPALLLIDGNSRIPDAIFAKPDYRHGLKPEQKTIINGDSLEPAISAASILAKTWRDKLMLYLDKRWPGYGFAAHKGYGTKAHLQALKELGPCPLHRRTFRGVRIEPENFTL